MFIISFYFICAHIRKPLNTKTIPVNNKYCVNKNEIIIVIKMNKTENLKQEKKKRINKMK